MTSRILHVEIQDRSLDPAQAELYVHVVLDQDADRVEVRGRLMGPRCPYSSTVEIAYPLRPLPGQATGTTRSFQVIIPEPSLWDTESPFIYQGPVELWQENQRCQVVPVSHGLRQLTLGRRGLRLNGRPLALHGLEVESAEENQLRSYRQRGINLLVAPVREETALVWALADRFGFLVLGRLTDVTDKTRRRLNDLTGHPSLFGWLLSSDTPSPDTLRGLTGFEPPGGTIASLPEGIQFLVAAEEQVPTMVQRELPLLVRVSAPFNTSKQGTLGWIATAP